MYYDAYVNVKSRLYSQRFGQTVPRLPPRPQEAGHYLTLAVDNVNDINIYRQKIERMCEGGHYLQYRYRQRCTTEVTLECAWNNV